MMTGRSIIWILTLALATSAGLLRAAEKPAPQPPDGARPYEAAARAEDGRNMVLAVEKLQKCPDPPRQLLIWAIGSSYTNKLGDGSQLIELIRQRFPDAPQMVYKKMVGNSVPYQYLLGWARHLVVPDQPDVVLIYTIGKADDLERVLVELRRNTTADILVPSIHWRERGKKLWEQQSEAAPDQDVAALKALCEKYGAEFVDNRHEWGEYLKANNLKIEDLLADAVHQSGYGALMINRNIARHFHAADRPGYDRTARERRIEAEKPTVVKTGQWKPTDDGRAVVATAAGSSIRVEFTGNRIDLVGRRLPGGGTADVRIDGRPASQTPAFRMTYIQPGAKNVKVSRSPPRDRSPHGVALGTGVVPQQWTITMTSDQGDYELVGSVTGPDGRGNAFRPFTSTSGQIVIPPELWRRAEKVYRGDQFTFEVIRSVAEKVEFDSAQGGAFRVRLALGLSNGPHTLELVARGDGPVAVDAVEVYQPPMK